jgi:Ca2+-binding EF-hand superfamily protein
MNDPALLKQKMRDLFLDFDSDQSGAISFDEFSAGMQKLAVDLTPEQIRALFRVLDLDGSGQVSALEIDSLAINVIGTSAVEALIENLGKATVVDPLKLRESLAQLVESLDADKDGDMSLDELKRGFKARPELKLSDEQIEALFAVTDADKSNTISKDELLAKLQRSRNDLYGERERFADGDGDLSVV